MRDGTVDIFDTWLRSRTDAIHTALPGEIVSYTGHQERKAKVQPLVNIRTSRNQILSLPTIDDVPVLLPGSNNFQFKFPIKRGDGVLLIFSESSIGSWLTKGGQQDAQINDRFSLTDCIAIPGLWSFVDANSANNASSYIELDDQGKLIVTNGLGIIELGTSGQVNINNHLTIDI